MCVALRAAKCQSGRSPSIPMRMTITTMIPWTRETIRRTRRRPCRLDSWARPCGSTSILVNRYPVRKQDHLAQSCPFVEPLVGSGPISGWLATISLSSSYASSISVCIASGICSYSSASLYPPFFSRFLCTSHFFPSYVSLPRQVSFEIESKKSDGILCHRIKADRSLFLACSQ